MQSVISTDPQSDILNACFSFLTETNDSNQMESGRQFLYKFREEDELLFIDLLSNLLKDEKNDPKVRALAAIFITITMKRNKPEDQKVFDKKWYSKGFDFRKKIYDAARSGIEAQNEKVTTQSKSLLGLILAVEFKSDGIREQALILRNFQKCLVQLCETVYTCKNNGLIYLIYDSIMWFSIYSLEFSSKCPQNQSYKNYAPNIFKCLMWGIINNDDCLIQERASNSMIYSMPLFRRHLSFKNNTQRSDLLKALFAYIESDLVVQEAKRLVCFFTIGYDMLRKFIDHFYTYIFEISEFTSKFVQCTMNDLQSQNPERQIGACLAWLTVGEVEYDILVCLNQNNAKRLHKERHREFDRSFKLSETYFQDLFPLLVKLIHSTPEDQVAANISIDRTPSHAAFTCLSELAISADHSALTLMFDYVKANYTSSKWIDRYTSALLLNATVQLPSFELSFDTTLEAFQLFLNYINDSIPRIVEVSMWSLGRMIDRVPEIAHDEGRFNKFCEIVQTKIKISPELTTRGCWLITKLFSVFSPGDEDSFIAKNFVSLSNMLLDSADIFEGKGSLDALDAAYGALDKLIERTPSTLLNQYSNLLDSVIKRLEPLVRKTSSSSHPYQLHQAIGLLSFVQAIVFNISPYISDHKVLVNLIPVLVTALQNQSLVTEVLRALGAIIRALGDEGKQYIPQLIDPLKGYLSKVDMVSDAALFISDIYSVVNLNDPQITNTFVELLFNAYESENSTPDIRISIISALTEIAKQFGDKCLPWCDHFLEQIRSECSTVLGDPDEFESSYFKNFCQTILTCYQTMVSIFAEVPKGDKRVRNFFYIFDKLSNQEELEEVIQMEAVLLIKLIAKTFGRKMNVFLNRKNVREILKRCQDSDNDTLKETAVNTLDIIEGC